MNIERSICLSFRRFAVVGLLLAGQLLYTGQSGADAWQGTLATRVSTEYETNPTMSQTQQRGVWQGLFDPSYTLAGRVGKSEITTGLALQIARSSNKTLSPDRDSPSVFINWLRPGEAGELGISTRYTEVSTRDTGGIDATGRVPADSTRASRTLSGNWNMELTERSSLSADGVYEGVTYNGSGAYTDYSMRSGGLRFSYIINEQITSFIRVSGNKYLPVGGGPSSSLTDAALGMNWTAEYVDWSMQVSKSRVVGGQSDTQGSVSVHYTGQQTQLTLNAERSISPSGLGGFVKADQVRGGGSYAVSEYSNVGIDMEWRKIPSTATTSESINTSSGVWIDHSFTSFWSMRTYCQRRSARGGGSASSNLLGLSFVYSNTGY